MDEQRDDRRLDDDDERDGNVTKAASRYPLWLIAIGVVVFALVLFYIGTTLLPGSVTGP